MNERKKEKNKWKEKNEWEWIISPINRRSIFPYEFMGFTGMAFMDGNSYSYSVSDNYAVIKRGIDDGLCAQVMGIIPWPYDKYVTTMRWPHDQYVMTMWSHDLVRDGNVTFMQLWVCNGCSMVTRCVCGGYVVCIHQVCTAWRQMTTIRWFYSRHRR